jgi:hypothetical protein
MGNKQQLVKTESEERLVLREGVVQDEETGLYRVVKQDKESALAVTRSAFALSFLAQQSDSHMNWVIGDILVDCRKRHGDDFYSHLDDFAEMVGWNYKQLDQRQRTSKLFCHAHLRCMSYSPKSFAEAYPNMPGVEGVSYPLHWRHFREVALVAEGDLEDKMNFLRLAWYLGKTPAQTRRLYAAIVRLGLDVKEEAKNLVGEAEKSAAACEELCADHLKSGDTRLGGKYILLFQDAEEGFRMERHLELTPALYDRCENAYKLVGSNIREIVEYDGHIEEMRDVETFE